MVRSLLSQMDVPTRTSYVMAVVTTVGTSRRGEPDVGPSQPGVGGEPGDRGLPDYGIEFCLAASDRGPVEDGYDLALLAMFSFTFGRPRRRPNQNATPLLLPNSLR